MNNEYSEALGKNIRYKKEFVGNDTYRLYMKKYDIELLEKYLTELEQIKNTKPSEAWRELNIIRHLEIGFDKNGKPITLNDIDGLNTIKQALIKAQEDEEENERLWNDITTVDKQYTDLMLTYQEQKKVLDIIKEKGIDIGWLEQCETVEKYNYHCEANQLTQEEFDILKRYFK